MKATLAQPDTVMIITSDHGNVEKMLDPLTGLMETKHDPNPVPFYLIGKKFEQIKNEAETQKAETPKPRHPGRCRSHYFKFIRNPQPKEMNGNNLCRFNNLVHRATTKFNFMVSFV